MLFTSTEKLAIHNRRVVEFFDFLCLMLMWKFFSIILGKHHTTYIRNDENELLSYWFLEAIFSFLPILQPHPYDCHADGFDNSLIIFTSPTFCCGSLCRTRDSRACKDISHRNCYHCQHCHHGLIIIAIINIAIIAIISIVFIFSKSLPSS